MAKDKDYNHLRNHVWGDLKKRVVEKRDRLARTGSQGEELTPLEKLVLEAVGPESAVVEGLPVREQWGEQGLSMDPPTTSGRSSRLVLHLMACR